MTVQAQAEKFAEWIKERMGAIGIRFAAELAESSGISAQGISGMLTPRRSPNTGKYHLPRRETVAKLARPLGVTVEEALTAAGYLSAPAPAPASPSLLQSDFAVLYFEAEGLTTEEARRDVDVAVGMLRDLIRKKKAEEMEAKK